MQIKPSWCRWRASWAAASSLVTPLASNLSLSAQMTEGPRSVTKYPSSRWRQSGLYGTRTRVSPCQCSATLMSSIYSCLLHPAKHCAHRRWWDFECLQGATLADSYLLTMLGCEDIFRLRLGIEATEALHTRLQLKEQQASHTCSIHYVNEDM